LPIAWTVALVFSALPALAHDASAKAPPLATTVLATEILATPAIDAPAIGSVSQGTELELTGSAAPGFLAVYYDGEVGWVPAQYLSLGQRPGIDTAVTTEDAALREAPMRDAATLGTVPEGETVILTGASVDGYDAASHEGIGGWINERQLAR
jgi:hypothetical protein